MTPLEQIQQDIQTLPENMLNLLSQFIQVLKKSQSPQDISDVAIDPIAKAPETVDWSDFIGCIDAEADLSVNYKTYLSEELSQKYDHH